MSGDEDSDCIRVEGLRKRFAESGGAESEVLRGISLAVRRGELVGLTGRSGSGKSTLLNIMGGLDRDYQGKVWLLGEDLAKLSDRALASLRNRHIGFVFQAFHLLSHLSCLDNVLLPNAFAVDPLPRAEAEKRAKAALERVGLVEKMASRPTELSGGQKQRVAIARALLFRPEVLLCDEPTGNLDDITGQQIISLFGELNRDGLTMVLVTHEPRVAEATTRLCRLQDGLVISDGNSGTSKESLP
ncbi:MAG TPA: ABC transporter ATP-binding protein [Pseudomonadota bacterium]|nr:ABC transporter ATP-binding protein [Pseudomonadota bacterium]